MCVGVGLRTLRHKLLGGVVVTTTFLRERVGGSPQRRVSKRGIPPRTPDSTRRRIALRPSKAPLPTYSVAGPVNGLFVLLEPNVVVEEPHPCPDSSSVDAVLIDVVTFYERGVPP